MAVAAGVVVLVGTGLRLRDAVEARDQALAHARQALAAERSARLQLVEGLLSLGDSQLAQGDPAAALETFTQATSGLRALGANPWVADLGAAEAATLVPPALSQRRAHRGDLLELAVAPDDASVWTLGSDDRVGHWALPSLADLGSQEAAAWPTVATGRSTGTADGTLVLTAGDAGELSLHAAVHPSRHRITPAPDTPLDRLAISPDGRLALVASPAGDAWMIELTSRRILAALTGPQLGPGPLRWSADGLSVGFAGAEGSRRTLVLATWQVRTGSDPAQTKPAVASVPEGMVGTAMALSPDGRLLALTGSGGEVGIYDAARGAVLREVVHHAGAATDVAWAGASGPLVTVGTDGRVALWHLDAHRRAWDQRTQLDAARGTDQEAAAAGGSLLQAQLFVRAHAAFEASIHAGVAVDPVARVQAALGAHEPVGALLAAPPPVGAEAWWTIVAGVAGREGG